MNGYTRITGSVLAALAIAALGVVATSSHGWAQAEGEAQSNIAVGTYNPERVFNAYPDREQLMNQITELQGQMQQAQQQQDQQRMMELQQQMQQQQTEAIDQFESAVEQAVPEVAEEAGLDLVGIEVTWTRDGVETQDITDEVIEALGGDPEPAQPQFMVPGAE